MNDERVDLSQELLTRNACLYGNGVLKLSKWILCSIDGVAEIKSDRWFFGT